MKSDFSLLVRSEPIFHSVTGFVRSYNAFSLTERLQCVYEPILRSFRPYNRFYSPRYHPRAFVRTYTPQYVPELSPGVKSSLKSDCNYFETFSRRLQGTPALLTPLSTLRPAFEPILRSYTPQYGYADQPSNLLVDERAAFTSCFCQRVRSIRLIGGSAILSVEIKTFTD